MNGAPVQQKIIIDDIQEGVVVLAGGGGLRAILMTSSTNFALKSADEQDALISKYQMFLNSLDFSLQILIISRQLDISDYLAALDQKSKEQPNELLKIQISEYIDFIKNLIDVSNIMSQSFFVVVPIANVEKKESEGLLGKLNFLSSKKSSNENKSTDDLRAQLWQRVEYIVSGLAGMGLKSIPLNTQEITELFYHLYNMGATEKPALVKETKSE